MQALTRWNRVRSFASTRARIITVTPGPVTWFASKLTRMIVKSEAMSVAGFLEHIPAIEKGMDHDFWISIGVRANYSCEQTKL